MAIPKIAPKSTMNPFVVLIICIILNILTILLLYRMIDDVRKEHDEFVFAHQNSPSKYHPLSKKNTGKIEQLENKVDILTERGELR